MLVNEYFVLCLKGEEASFVDPCSGRQYVVCATVEGKRVMQSYVTKLIMLFDNKEIMINL